MFIPHAASQSPDGQLYFVHEDIRIKPKSCNKHKETAPTFIFAYKALYYYANIGRNDGQLKMPP